MSIYRARNLGKVAGCLLGNIRTYRPVEVRAQYQIKMQFAYAVLLRVGRLNDEDDEEEEDDDEEAGRLNEEDDEEEEAGRLKEEDDEQEEDDEEEE